MIQDALKYAEQNPESSYAQELRRRIESGALNNELEQSGLMYKPGVGIVQKKSTLESIVETAGQIAGVSNIGKGIGQAVANKKIASGLETAQNQATDIQTQILQTIRDKKSRGEDTTRLEGALADLGGSIQTTGEQTSSLLNQNDISGKKIAGDVIQIGSYMFPFGKVASGASKLLGKTGGAVASGATGGYLADIGFNLQNEASGTDVFKPGATTAIAGAIPVAGTAIGALAKGSKKVVDTEKTIGKILQSKKDQVELGKKAQEVFGNIDIGKVKTFDELSAKIQQGMDEQLKKADVAYSKDPNMYKLGDLAVKTANKAGQEVTTDYVGEALKNLDELYTAIGDNTSKSNVGLLIEKAVNDGLTRSEVNNIARMYSSEFGSKGYTAMGDALTSVNAQKFQNVQRGLKTVARAGEVGTEGQVADELYSAMRKTKELIDKNAEAVASLKQKINERSTLEKAGRGVVNILDSFSGGFLRGVIRGATQSNVGLKVQNWLDIAKNLEKNLKLLHHADKITEPNALIQFLHSKIQSVKFPGDSVVDNTKPYIDAAKKNLKNPKNAQGGFIKLYRAGTPDNTKGIFATDSEELAKMYSKDRNTKVIEVNLNDIPENQIYSTTSQLRAYVENTPDSTLSQYIRYNFLNETPYLEKGVIYSEGEKRYAKRLFDSKMKSFERQLDKKNMDMMTNDGKYNFVASIDKKVKDILSKKGYKLTEYTSPDELPFSTVSGAKEYQILDESIIKSNLGGKSDDLIQEAKKYKSAEEFVKAQPKVYRGEGGSNIAQGKALLAEGKHFASDAEYPKGFGKVGEYVLKPNAKVLDLGDSTFAEISQKLGIPERKYISPKEL